VKRPALLDASFLIDLEREAARGEVGPARRTGTSNGTLNFEP